MSARTLVGHIQFAACLEGATGLRDIRDGSGKRNSFTHHGRRAWPGPRPSSSGRIHAAYDYGLTIVRETCSATHGGILNLRAVNRLTRNGKKPVLCVLAAPANIKRCRRAAFWQWNCRSLRWLAGAGGWLTQTRKASESASRSDKARIVAQQPVISLGSPNSLRIEIDRYDYRRRFQETARQGSTVRDSVRHETRSPRVAK